MTPSPRAPVLSSTDGALVAARAVLRYHLRGFAQNEAAARAGEVEPVHQLRVATRRLRAALRVFAPVLPARFADAARRDMAWLAAAIGGVRDLDVLGGALADQGARLPAELRSALGPVALTIHDQRTAAHAALVAALDSARCRRLLDRLATFADAAAPQRREPQLGTLAPDLVRPLLRDVLRAGRRIEPTSPPEAFHRLRVRVKRLRYALETVRGLGAKATGKLLRRLERMQEFLGEHQDAVTEAAWLRRWAETEAPPPATAFAAGAVTYVLLRRAAKRRARFPDRWRGIERPKLRTRVLAELGAPRVGAGARMLRAVS